MSELKQQLDNFANTISALSDYQTSSAEQVKSKEEVALHKKTALNERFVWLSELEKGETNLSWIWHGFIAKNLVTLISAAPKTGKTTLLVYLLAALESGGDFLGQHIEKTKVLIVTEESKAGWCNKRDAAGLLGENAGIIPRFLCSRRSAVDWEEAILDLRNLCQQKDIKLVIFDTISYFWLVSDENQATPVNDALRPLHNLTEVGIGVVLVHHDRKSGGSSVDSSRGSSALTGFVDIIISLKKGDGGKRILKSDGRFSDETPSELTIELIDEHYVLIAGDASTSEKTNKFDEVVLPHIPTEGITTQNLLTKLEANGVSPLPNRTTLQRWLKKAIEQGEVKVIGKADVTGKPDLWARVIDSKLATDNFEDEVKEALF